GGTGGLQQCAALAQDLVVLAADAGQPRREEDEQVVEETSSGLGVALDELEVLGGEDDAAHDPQHVAGAADRRAVEACPVGLAGDDLELDERLAAGPDGLGADDGAAGAVADERGVRGDPVAGERTEVGDCLDDVRLALAVVPDEGRDAGVEREDELGVGPEVVQGEVGDVHPQRSSERRMAWPPNSWRRAAIALRAGDSSWREANRAKSAAAIVCAGTALSMASSRVHRPSPESAA